MRANTEKYEGLTPFLCACLSGDLKTVQILISNGANINDTTKNGSNAAHICCEDKQRFQVLKYLLMRGLNINAKDSNGKTPLFIACEKQNIEAIIYLFDRKTELNIIDEYNRSILFLLSSQSTSLEIINKIISQSLDDVNKMSSSHCM